MSDQPIDATKKRAPTPRKRKPASKKTSAAAAPAPAPAPTPAPEAKALDLDAAAVDTGAAVVPATRPEAINAGAGHAASGPEPSNLRASQREASVRDQARPERPQPDRPSPERADPERADPERADPERVDPKRVDPERAAPDRAMPDRARSKRNSPDRAKPERSRSEQRAAPRVGAPTPSAADVATTAATSLIQVPLSVRWRDLDAFNHVNNSKYLSYLEEARLRWMMTIPGMGLEDHVAPVVAASTLNYRRPVEWPGEVVIDLFVERMGTTSLTIGHRIRDARDDAILYCDGNVVLVWIERDNGRAAPLPDGVRAACGH